MEAILEKDLKEGILLLDKYEKLSEDDKAFASIYIQALYDRNLREERRGEIHNVEKRQ